MTRNERSKQINDILSKVEPRYKKAFLEAIQDIRSNVKLAEIERLVERGEYQSVLNTINQELIAGVLFAFLRQIQNTVQDGGDLAALWAKKDGFFAARMNIVDSYTAKFISDYQSSKIRGLSEEIADYVRRSVAFGLYNNLNSKQIARKIVDNIGLTFNQQLWINNYEAELRAGDAGALKRDLRDKRYDRTIRMAVDGKKQLSEGDIKKITDKYREKFLMHRAETIARTESVRLLNAGKRQLWEQAIRSGKVLRSNIGRFWLPTYDGKLREAHRAIPNMNPDGVGMDQPFKSPLGDIMFPGDPNAKAGNVVNCRCGLWHKVLTV